MPDVVPEPTEKPTVIERGIATNLGLAGAAAAAVPVIVDLLKDGKLPEWLVRLVIIFGGVLAALAMIGRYAQAILGMFAKARVAVPEVPAPPGLDELMQAVAAAVDDAFEERFEKAQPIKGELGTVTLAGSVDDLDDGAHEASDGEPLPDDGLSEDDFEEPVAEEPRGATE